MSVLGIRSYKVKCIGSPQCARCETAGILCQFDFTEKKVRDGPLLDSMEVLQEHDAQREHDLKGAHDVQQRQYEFDVEQSSPTMHEADQMSVGSQNVAAHQEWQNYSAGTLPSPSDPNLEENDSGMLLDGLTPSSSSTKESGGAESASDSNQRPGPPVSAWCGTPEQAQNYIADELFEQPVLDWDLPTPFPPGQVDLNLGLEHTLSQLPGPHTLGLSPFGWTDLVGTSPSISENGDNGSTHQIADDGSKRIVSEAASIKKALPWVHPGTTLDDMYDALTANTYPHWCRETPRINQSEAQQYWGLYFERFNQVGSELWDWAVKTLKKYLHRMFRFSTSALLPWTGAIPFCSAPC